MTQTADPVLGEDVLAALEEVLPSPATRVDYVTSGAANHVFRARTADGSWIVKVSKTDIADLFACEADALRRLAATQTVAVPAVVAAHERLLLLEDLGPQEREPRADDWFRVGEELGRLHAVTTDRFGDAADNYLGIWRQHNPWTDDWLTFFAENRVLCYLDTGHNADVLDAADRRAIERLLGTLGATVPDQPPALCHGDLWRNNLHLGASDRFSVIDPAIHFGLAEADLAMTQMYDVFPPEFYAGYRTAHDLAADWTDRLPLYQLKELLLMSAQFRDEHAIRTLKESLQPYR